jgi:hypothetical protein
MNAAERRKRIGVDESASGLKKQRELNKWRYLFAFLSKVDFVSLSHSGVCLVVDTEEERVYVYVYVYVYRSVIVRNQKRTKQNKMQLLYVKR